MKTYIKFFIIFLNCVFNASVIAKCQEVLKETELETEIKNLISQKSNFKKNKTEKIASYKDLIEYKTNVRPLNWSYNLSVLENSNNKTAAFIYTNNIKTEVAFFYMHLYVFLENETKSWKTIYEKEKVKNISRITISYNGKTVGFLHYDKRTADSKIILFIGNLKMEDIDTYLSAIMEKEKLDFLTESNSTNSDEDESAKKNTDDFLKGLSSFMDSISPPIKILDSAEKAKNEKETILAFMRQFDSIPMNNWGINSKKYIDSIEAERKADSIKQEQLDRYSLKTMSKEIMDIISQRSNGFINLKKAVQSKTDDKTYYYAKPNYYMSASSEYIIEKNGKNAYCAYYKNVKEKRMSSDAFLLINFLNKSEINFRIEVSKIKEPNKIRFNMYVDDVVVASYITYLDTKISSIQVYQLGY